MPRADAPSRARSGSRPGAKGTGRARRRPGFTLVELVVVLVVLGVLAAVVLPRLAGNAARRAENEARAVQQLLSALAERSSLIATEQLALEYDAAASRLEVLAQRRDRAADPSATGYAASAWGPDPLLPPVMLSELSVDKAAADGQPLDRDRWRVVFRPGAARPSLSLDLKPAEGAGAPWHVRLTPEASAAQRVSAERAAVLDAETGVIDLDATGRGEQAW